MSFIIPTLILLKNPTKHSQGFKKSKIIKKFHLLSKILRILLHEPEKNEADKLDPNAFKIESVRIRLYYGLFLLWHKL